MPVPLNSLLRMLAAAAVCGLGAAAIVHAWTSPLALLVAVPTGGLLYLVSLRWMRAVHAEDRAAFERFFARSPRWLSRPVLASLRFIGGVR
jgi:hypothetical protein